MADLSREEEAFSEELRKKVAKAVFRAHRTIVEAAPIDTGRLRQSIVVEETDDGWIIGTNLDYAEYLENGTGIFGPTGRPITPKRAKALHWESGGEDVFAKSVKGVKAHHFFQKGALQLERELREVMSR